MIVIVPSRGRPQRAALMAASVKRTATGPVRVIVGVDPDDPKLDDYRRKVPDLLILPERLYYSGVLNAVAREVWDGDEILGAFGDDVLFRTRGWDAMVTKTLSTPGIAFPNDLAHGAGWPTAVFMSATIARALGYLALPRCRHQYVDNAWKTLGDELGVLRYMPDVVCEHLHPAYKKADMDATYHEVYGPHAPIDNAAFHSWLEDGLPDDAERVRAVL